MDSSAGQKYSFGQETAKVVSKKHAHGRRHRRGHSRGDGENQNDDHSLEYSASASSSVMSENAGDSTDSSTFNDIIRVLDLEDKDGLLALMKKEKDGSRGTGTAAHEPKDTSLGSLNFAAADPLEESKSDLLRKHAKDRTPKSKNGARVRPCGHVKIKHTIDPFDVTAVKNK